MGILTVMTSYYGDSIGGDPSPRSIHWQNLKQEHNPMYGNSIGGDLSLGLMQSIDAPLRHGKAAVGAACAIFVEEARHAKQSGTV